MLDIAVPNVRCLKTLSIVESCCACYWLVRNDAKSNWVWLVVQRLRSHTDQLWRDRYVLALSQLSLLPSGEASGQVGTCRALVEKQHPQIAQGITSNLGSSPIAPINPDIPMY